MGRMSATALGLVLFAALLHALWNVVAKRTGGDARFALVAALFLVRAVGAARRLGRLGRAAALGPVEWAVLLASAVVHVVYFTTLLRGYRLSDLTVVYPVARGTGPLLASLGAIALARRVDERRSPPAASPASPSASSSSPAARACWARAHDPLQRARVRAGIGWGAATGALIAGYTLIDGYAVKVLLISPILVDYVGNVFRVPFLLPAALRDRRGFAEVWRSQWRAALVVAVLGPLGYVLVLYAMRLAPISHVAPAREVSMLFAALIGGRLLGEGDRVAPPARARPASPSASAPWHSVEGGRAGATCAQSLSSRQKERLGAAGTSAALPHTLHSRGARPQPGNEQKRPQAAHRRQERLARGKTLGLHEAGASGVGRPGRIGEGFGDASDKFPFTPPGGADRPLSTLPYTRDRDPVSLLQGRKPAEIPALRLLRYASCGCSAGPAAA